MNTVLQIGKTLKEFRLAKKLTLDKLAELAHVDKSFLSKIENDKRDPSITCLNQICIALDVPIGIFILMADETEDEFSGLSSVLKAAVRANLA